MSPSWPEMIKLYSLEWEAKKYIIYVGKISSVTVCVTVVVSAIPVAFTGVLCLFILSFDELSIEHIGETAVRGKVPAFMEFTI